MLGSPIGSQEYASTFAEHKIDEARRVLKLITDLLLDRDSSGASNTGVFSPDEHNILMRYTIRSKVSHLLRTLPPDTASHHFDKLHSEMIDAHLNVSPQFHSVSLESDPIAHTVQNLPPQCASLLDTFSVSVVTPLTLSVQNT